MSKLLMLKGLPGSGKTHYARSLEGYKRVNMDDLRRMLDDGTYSKANEFTMQQIRRCMIYDLLIRDHSVVVDDTNFHDKHPTLCKVLVENVNSYFIENGLDTRVRYEEKFIDTPVEECIKRDLKRQHSVGKDVIMRMYNQYVKPPALDQEWDLGLPSCVIVDIDGTVANMTTRSPYDWKKVGEDEPKLEILGLVDMLEANHEIIFLSGRDSQCRNETLTWLQRHVGHSRWQLYMRPEGDNRKDTVIKEELYTQYVKGVYNVHLVLDDRDCVVELWRDLGLTCLQVAQGDF